MKNKYHAKKKTIKGHIFASMKEAARYMYLDKLQLTGAIKDLMIQPKYILQEGFTLPDGKNVRPIHYIADFSYYNTETGQHIIEDVKGFRTRDYVLKRKMFLKFLKADEVFEEI